MLRLDATYLTSQRLMRSTKVARRPPQLAASSSSPSHPMPKCDLKRLTSPLRVRDFEPACAILTEYACKESFSGGARRCARSCRQPHDHKRGRRRLKTEMMDQFEHVDTQFRATNDRLRNISPKSPLFTAASSTWKSWPQATPDSPKRLVTRSSVSRSSKHLGLKSENHHSNR